MGRSLKTPSSFSARSVNGVGTCRPNAPSGRQRPLQPHPVKLGGLARAEPKCPLFNFGDRKLPVSRRP